MRAITKWTGMFLAGAMVFTAVAVQAKAKKTLVVKPAADLVWVPLPGTPPGGPTMAFVKGDLKAKTPVAFLLKVPNGFDSGIHTHANDYQATVISGAVTHQLENEPDQTAKALGPGSWWNQPANEKHKDRCVAPEGCEVYVSFEGPFTFIPAAKPEPKM